MSKRFTIILYAFLITGTLYFIFVGLIKGSSFLIPLTTAIILSMVMSPVSKKFQSWGVSRGLAIFLADLVVVLFIGLMIFLLAAQAGKVADNWPQIQSKLQPKIQQAQDFFNNKLNMPMNQQGQSSQNQSQQNQSQQQGQDRQNQQDQPRQGQQQQGQQQGQQNQQQQQDQQDQQTQQDQQQGTEQRRQGGQQGQQPLGGDTIRSMLTGFVTGVFSVLGDMLLILVYIFFFLYYQQKFEDALVGLAAPDKRDKTRSVIHQSSEIAQKYLFGRFILIFFLALLYLAGFTLSGLEYAFFISMIAALFSLLPYIGNVIGLALALGMAFISGGETGQLIGIAITFSIAQFVESYILEPYVVGDKVDLNPVVIIVVVVLGGIVWGIMGMILVIPIVGIMKVVFDNVEALRPLGYVLDERGIPKDDGWTKKIKGWFKRRKQ